MLYTTLGLLCKKQARIISLSSDDNSSGKLEAVDQMKFGLSLIWLALESNSLELPCQCKLGKVQDFSDYSGVHQEAGWPPARARLWAIGHTCVLSLLDILHLTLFVPNLSHGGRSLLQSWGAAQTGSLGNILRFSGMFSWLGKLFDPISVPGSKSEKETFSCNTGQSYSQRSLCYNCVCSIAPLWWNSSAKTPVCLSLREVGWQQRGWATAYSSCPASFCPTAFLSLAAVGGRMQATYCRPLLPGSSDMTR